MASMTDRPRADVEEMVRRLRNPELRDLEQSMADVREAAATLLSQEHARAEQLERQLADDDMLLAALGRYTGEPPTTWPKVLRIIREAKERHASRASPKP